jgi:thiol-disulfide isomerase/thioredoxin
MKKQAIYIIIIVLAAILLTLGLSLLNNSGSVSSGPGPYDGLASCLKDKGVKFYGAFWCPHCAEQKKLFGNSVKLLPYIECSTPDAMGQTQVCIDAKIESYPTWVFPDGTRVTGGLTPAELAAKSGCSIGDNSSLASSTASISTSTSAVTPAKK